MPTVVTAGNSAEKDTGEEDHRDDEQDTGDDADPREDLIDPGGPMISGIVVPGWWHYLSRRYGFVWGFRCLSHIQYFLGRSGRLMVSIRSSGSHVLKRRLTDLRRHPYPTSAV
jgi:hypothetical protein